MDNSVSLVIKNEINSKRVGLYNGDFSDNISGWTFTPGVSYTVIPTLVTTLSTPTGWTYDQGIVKHVNSSYDASIEQVINIFTGVTYTVVIKMMMLPDYFNNISVGNIRVDFGDQTQYITGKSGTYKLTFIANSGNILKITKYVNQSFLLKSVNVLYQKEFEYIPVEHYGDDFINLNFSISDIEDISKRAFTYSKTFKVPGTNYNNSIFNNLWNLDIVNNTEIYLNKKVPCILSYNDNTLLKNGMLYINKVYYNEELNMSEYECNLYSNTKYLSDYISDKLIIDNTYKKDDLDFSEYDELLLRSNIINSWSNTTSTGLYYPIIDYSHHKSGGFSVENFRPALYIKEIWDKIFFF